MTVTVRYLWASKPPQAFVCSCPFGAVLWPLAHGQETLMVIGLIKLSMGHAEWAAAGEFLSAGRRAGSTAPRSQVCLLLSEQGQSFSFLGSAASEWVMVTRFFWLSDVNQEKACLGRSDYSVYAPCSCTSEAGSSSCQPLRSCLLGPSVHIFLFTYIIF